MGVALAYRADVFGSFADREVATLPVDDDGNEVVRARAGDHAAFETLVSRHEAAVFRICRRLLADREDALEASQETFLRAFRGLPRFRGAASFRTWLIGIAVNACRSRLVTAERRARRHTVGLEAETADGEAAVELPLPDPAPSPEARALGSELRRALLGALAAVSAEHREVLVLREIEGLDYAEIAAMLGVAVGTVKSRLARARAALRAELEGVWP